MGEIIQINIGTLAKKTAWLTAREALLGTSVHIQKVENNSQLEESGALQSKISKHIKALSKDRLDLTRQIDSAKKEVMAKEKELVKDLQCELDRLKRINSIYATEQARIAEEKARIERQKAEEEARKQLEAQQTEQDKAKELFGDDADFVEEEAPEIDFFNSAPVRAKPKTSANSFVDTWHFNIENSAKIPRMFLIPDVKKIRQFIQMQKEMAQIDGVKIWKTVSVRSK